MRAIIIHARTVTFYYASSLKYSFYLFTFFFYFFLFLAFKFVFLNLFPTSTHVSQSLSFALLSRMVAELLLGMPWSPSYELFKLKNLVSLLRHFKVQLER